MLVVGRLRFASAFTDSARWARTPHNDIEEEAPCGVQEPLILAGKAG